MLYVINQKLRKEFTLGETDESLTEMGVEHRTLEELKSINLLKLLDMYVSGSVLLFVLFILDMA